MATLLSLYLSLMARMNDEEGQGLVEYALIIALVSVLLVVSLTALKDGIAGVFSDIVSHF